LVRRADSARFQFRDELTYFMVIGPIPDCIVAGQNEDRESK
jgi:hypothetical protein